MLCNSVLIQEEKLTFTGKKPMPSKYSTELSHKERVNTIINYIDAHIENPSYRLDLDTLASVACLSYYHISRIFKSYTGEGIHQYVKRLRLENAAKQLLYSQKSIQSIAESSSYNNFPAFTKAFKQHFGYPPSDFREKRNIPGFNKIRSAHAKKSTNGKNIVDMQTKTIADQKVMFTLKIGPYEDAANRAWSSLMQYGYSSQLITDKTMKIGITYDMPEFTHEERIRYCACITADHNYKAEGDIGIKLIQGGRFATFIHQGPYAELCYTYDYIYKNWYSKNRVILGNQPSFSIYLTDPGVVEPENLLTEIYVPIE